MKKNIASQLVSCQLNKADGTPFTGTAIVLVNKNGAGQVASVGTGPTHQGHGSYLYHPTQAETNYDHVAFTFYDAIGDAVPDTKDFYPEASTLGTGSIPWAYALTESGSGDPIANADVWVTSDVGGSVLLASGTTDAFGSVTFNLDAGTVYVWRARPGYNFVNPDTETVA